MYDGIVRTYNKSTFFLFTIRVLVSQAQIEMKEGKKKGKRLRNSALLSNAEMSDLKYMMYSRLTGSDMLISTIKSNDEICTLFI